MGVTIGGDAKKVAITLIFSDNAHEAIAENCSDQLKKPESIQRNKRLESTYEMCAQLRGNAFNVTYSIYVIRVHKCQPPWGVRLRSLRFCSPEGGLFSQVGLKYLCIIPFKNYLACTLRYMWM